MTENQLRYLAHQETVRHNAATEGISKDDLGERARHNVASELNDSIRNSEAQRHNIVTEQQSDRNLTEAYRSNRAREAETSMHNRMMEAAKGAELAVDASGNATKLLSKYFGG